MEKSLKQIAIDFCDSRIRTCNFHLKRIMDMEYSADANLHNIVKGHFNPKYRYSYARHYWLNLKEDISKANNNDTIVSMVLNGEIKKITHDLLSVKLMDNTNSIIYNVTSVWEKEEKQMILQGLECIFRTYENN